MPSLQEIGQEFWSGVWRCRHYHCRACCWPWGNPEQYQTPWGAYSGHRNHGIFFDRQRGKPMPAHRMAYELAHGGLMIFPGRYFAVCHRCDFGMCCNPAHLCLGSCADNGRDRRGKTQQAQLLQYALLPDGRRVMFVHPAERASALWRYACATAKAERKRARLARQEATHGAP